jgi:DNA-directed RNA polymerase specialized sigma24 family protein
MKIPDGMTEEQVIKTITTVCDRISPRYTFYGYTIDDIKQEAFIICIEALNRYDGVRPLENFLSVNLSNRLKTFMRDNYFTGSSSENRKKVFQPAQLDYEDHIIDEKETFGNSYDDLDMKQMVSVIDEHIPANIRMDYLKIINDIYVAKQRREEVIMIIQQILEDYGYTNEEG